MANTNAISGVLVDGQLTIETKDITNPASPLPLTTFTTTAMDYAYDLFRPGFLITFYKDKGLSSERQLTIALPTGQEPHIVHYSETLTTKSEKHLYDFEIDSYTANIETMVITSDKRRYNVIELKIRAKRRNNDEARELTGKGHIFITDQTMTR